MQEFFLNSLYKNSKTDKIEDNKMIKQNVS